MSRPPTVRAPLDVYLQPAVVGGGLGDIEEVLAVGRRLSSAGWPLRLFRQRGRPLPASVEGPWNWPPVRRTSVLARGAPRALTVTPWWGVSAAPAAERTGRPGVWSEETAEIERHYGRDQVLHLSLEEFARTLTSRQQTRERWREGGIARTEIARRMWRRSTAAEVRAFHDAYRTWRAFDRPNVLHLYTGFGTSRAFQQEFPEAIQTGPLWPERPPATRPDPGHWLWYASPSSSTRLAARLARALDRSRRSPLRIDVYGPRPFELPASRGIRWSWHRPTGPREWTRRLAAADLRIVTGSRTLLEALTVGGPFLYFNGVLDHGSRTRRHRPEKIEALLKVWRRRGVPESLRRDLADFARLRRADEVARQARDAPEWRRQFPGPGPGGLYSGTEDAGRWIERWTGAWARTPDPAATFVRLLRATHGRRSSRL